MNASGNVYCSPNLIFLPAQICNFALHRATSSLFLPPLPRESDAQWGQHGPSFQEAARKI